MQTLPHPVGQRQDSEQEMDRSHAAVQGQGVMERNQVNGREGFLEEVRSELVSLKEKTISTGIKGQKPSRVKGGVSKGTKQVTQGGQNSSLGPSFFKPKGAGVANRQTRKQSI